MTGHLAGRLAVALLLAAPVAHAQRSADQPLEHFAVPRYAAPVAEPPPACTAARERVGRLLPDVQADVPAELQAAVRAIASDLEPDQSPAEGWDYAASLASLSGDVGAGLWAELQALQLEWRPEYVTAAGVYLHLVGLTDDALVLLNCAYADGFRSPWLMEALANVHRKAGHAEEAKILAREALDAAPEDPILQTESAIAETGHPPPPPSPDDGHDPLPRALAELERHIDSVLAALHQHHALQNRVDAAGQSESQAQERQQMEDEMRAAFAATVESIRPLLPQARAAPPELQPLYRNMVLHSLIAMYLSVTGNMLTWCDELWNPFSGSSTLDISFWGEVLGLQPTEFTRRLRELRDFEYEGFRANVVGGWLDDFGAAPWGAFRDALSDWHDKASAHCMSLRPHSAEVRCQLEVDAEYCAASRQLLRDYIDTSEQWFQKGARGFDRVAARRIASAGLVVDDAFRYASIWARELKFPPGDAQGADMLHSLQELYDELVDMATGTGDANDGPGHMVRHQAEIYQIQKSNAEEWHAQLSAAIEEKCEPVDLRVMEALAREQADAVRSMLLDRLLHDVDAEWDPNASCTFSAGKYFRASIDIEGKVSVGGNWKWLEKALPGWLGEDGGKFSAARRFKVDFKGGEFVGASAGVDRSASYGPFTGKGSATLGVAWDSKTQSWKYPVEIGGSLGFGYKGKRKGADGKEQDTVGVECIPGKVRIRFDARVVARDAMDFLAAQRAR